MSAIYLGVNVGMRHGFAVDGWDDWRKVLSAI